jgi:hypothetical protein
MMVLCSWALLDLTAELSSFLRHWKSLRQAKPNRFPPILSQIVEVMDREGG